MDGIYLNINQKWDTNGGYNAMLDEFYHLWGWEPMKKGQSSEKGQSRNLGTSVAFWIEMRR